MLDYNEARRVYAGRVDKHLGRKLMSQVWMKYDADRDCYVVSQAWGNWENVNGKYKRLPKDKWTVNPYVEIYRTHLVIMKRTLTSSLHRLFRISTSRSRTITMSGDYWEGPNNAINGDPPIRMDFDTRTLSAAPPKMRKFDETKRKELNDMIKRIRNTLKVRTKLGAFRTLTRKTLDKAGATTNINHRWDVFQKPKEFLKVLKAVDETDITTFYSLLALIDYNSSYYHKRPDPDAETNWVENYNMMIGSMRERLRKQVGAVSYVDE